MKSKATNADETCKGSKQKLITNKVKEMTC